MRGELKGCVDEDGGIEKLMKVKKHLRNRWKSIIAVEHSACWILLQFGSRKF